MKTFYFNFLVFILFLTNLKFFGNAEVFSSIFGMEALLVTEHAVIEKLETRQKDLKRVDLYEKFIEYKSIHDTAMRDIPSFVSLPTNAFTLIKKLLIDYEEMFDLAIGYSIQQVFGNDTKLYFPDIGDLEGTVKAIFRIQETYDLETSDFSNGIIYGIDYGTKLSADDCFTIANQSFNLNLLYHSELWVKESLRHLSSEEKPTVSRSKVLDLYAKLARNAISLHATIDIVASLNEEGLKELQELVSWTRELLQKSRDRDANFDLSEINLFLRPNKTKREVYYDRACKGELIKSPTEQTKLKCRYFTNNLEYLKIAPFKIEEANLDPQLWVFHDVIYDSEIEELKSLVHKKLTRAGIQNTNASDPNKNIVEDIRTSQFAWLYPSQVKTVAKIHRRIADMTGLNMKSSEILQIGNYGVGGHYHIHQDYFGGGFSDPVLGNRISTTLIYLSDVEQGGATIFPLLDVILYPQKGSAAFWFNLFKDGTPDIRTTHAACPVIVGSKWVANSWNREGGQVFTRPCGLQQDSISRETFNKLYYTINS